MRFDTKYRLCLHFVISGTDHLLTSRFSNFNHLFCLYVQLKKLEARGRAAFLQGDISSATRYFMQVLEKQNSPEYSKPKSVSPKPKRDKPRSRSLLSLNNNDDEHVWILQTNTNEKR